MTTGGGYSWRDLAVRAAIVFSIAFAGFAASCALWLHEFSSPQIVFLGSGNRLSLLVSEGPARLVMATGDNPIAFENALTSVQPLFARRIDLLLIAGAGGSLLAPRAMRFDPHVRKTMAIAALRSSPEADEIGPVPAIERPMRIQLGPTVSVVIEHAAQFAANSSETFPAWRLTIERGQSRVVFLSDGSAAGMFPPGPVASVLAVSGADPLTSLQVESTIALVANAEAIDGPELRNGLAELSRPPALAFRVAPNEALRLQLVEGGVEIPSETAQPTGDSSASISSDNPVQATRRISRHGRLSIG